MYGTTEVIIELRAEVDRLVETMNVLMADSLEAVRLAKYWEAKAQANFIAGLERGRDLVAAHGVVAKDWRYPNEIIQDEIDRLKGQTNELPRRERKK